MSPAHDSGDSIGRDSLSLAVSAAVTAALGLVYWIVMGRLYTPAEVGVAAAVITTATMLSAFGNLGLGAYYERFLPVAGPATTTLVVRGLAAGAVCALILGAGFLMVGPTSEMLPSTADKLLFPFVVMVLSTFAMLDHVSIAVRRTHWAAVKNIVHAALKLVAAAALTLWMGQWGMIGSWIAIAAAAALGVWMVLRRRLRHLDVPATNEGTGLPPLSEQVRFIAGNYGIYVATALTPLLLPLIVISSVGAEENAYFAIVWSLVSAVLVLMTMLMGPYVAQASSIGADGAAAARRFIAVIAATAGLASVSFAVAGPFVLRLAGAEYAENGAVLLRMAAIAIPLAAFGIVFTGISRVRRKLLPALCIQVVAACILLSLSALWLPRHGLISVGWAMILAEAFIALAVVVPLFVWLRRGDQSSVSVNAPLVGAK